MKKIASLCVFAIFCLISVMAQEKIALPKPLPILAWAGIPHDKICLEVFNQ